MILFLYIYIYNNIVSIQTNLRTSTDTHTISRDDIEGTIAGPKLPKRSSENPATCSSLFERS